MAQTHGMGSKATRTSEYVCWTNMLQRCFNTKHPQFEHYGGRGITVCDRWRNSFEAFLADMGPKPGPDYTIERKENNTGYNPTNCIWATRKTQARNRGTNRMVPIDGRVVTIAEASEQIGIPYNRLHGRIYYGSDSGRNMLSPNRLYKNWNITHNGMTKNLSEWARETGLSETAIQNRLERYGWSVEEALTTPPYGRRRR